MIDNFVLLCKKFTFSYVNIILLLMNSFHLSEERSEGNTLTPFKEMVIIRSRKEVVFLEKKGKEIFLIRKIVVCQNEITGIYTD